MKTKPGDSTTNTVVIQVKKEGNEQEGDQEEGKNT